MPLFSQFTTPAGQSAKDFQKQPAGQQAVFEQAWSDFVRRSVETSQVGNPWSAVNDSPRALYFNPLGTNIDESTLTTVPVMWNAFPNRINAYLSNDSLQTRWQIADEGVAGQTCPQNPCDPNSPQKPFGPAGPRGWQDEYCEWAVTKANGKITAVMFTCENPEYWFLLWNVSPDLVLELYQQTLGTQAVQLADLYLLDAQGHPVVDPQTSRPAYNPINKWNNGTQANYGSTGPAGVGGAMHLTSPPNSLGAEIYLAAAATIQRYNGTTHITPADQLICCAQYGQPNRNSDPHIGQSVNQVVYNGGGAPVEVTLLNPVGLYLQLPDATSFNTAFTPPASATIPAGQTMMDCWTVVRGTAAYPSYPNNAALHLRFEVPTAWGFTVGDINMNYTSPAGTNYNGPVIYGAQLVEFLQVQLAAVGQAATAAIQNLPCVQNATAPLPAPSYLMDQAVYNASLFNKLDEFANLTPQILTLAQGETRANVLLSASVNNAKISLSFGPDVAVTIDSYDESAGTFLLTIAVAATALPGERALLLSQAGSQGIAAPGFLQVTAAAAPSVASAASVTKRFQHRFSRM